MDRTITRREFTMGMAAAGAMAASGPVLGALGANDRVRLGIIGVGNRGDQLIDAFKPHADAEFVAICDLYEPYIEFAKKKIGGNPFTTKNYRELLDRKDIDAVLIATPDHWHALQFIDACKAGKDVYVEKPLSLTISEGRKMVEAAARYNRVAQMGNQRRSSPVYRKAIEMIREGKIGKITAARCYHIRNESPLGLGNPADGNPPAGLDWDMWLGPAPKVPYNENRGFYKFRWFKHYSGGQMTNFGTHYVDVIQWALGDIAPAGVFAVGSRTGVADNREVPVTMEAVWDYPDGAIVTFSQYNANSAPGTAKGSAIEIRGTKATMYFNGENLEIVPETLSTVPLPALSPLHRDFKKELSGAVEQGAEPFSMKGGDATKEHARSFLDCVKSRKTPNSPVAIGHKSTSSTLLANVALDRKQYLAWDGEHDRITNDLDANRLLSYEYRAPWKLPD
jgi:predicted dehydrogenase